MYPAPPVTNTFLFIAQSLQFCLLIGIWDVKVRLDDKFKAIPSNAASLYIAGDLRDADFDRLLGWDFKSVLVIDVSCRKRADLVFRKVHREMSGGSLPESLHGKFR